mmetsp:Transcript_13220/g.28531  ORF Transcript_13220/g.28531 Transcript_13220/m.28531 type:complete len:241 (-) Transcript_13220:1021-1743(-)
MRQARLASAASLTREVVRMGARYRGRSRNRRSQDPASRCATTQTYTEAPVAIARSRILATGDAIGSRGTTMPRFKIAANALLAFRPTSRAAPRSSESAHISQASSLRVEGVLPSRASLRRRWRGTRCPSCASAPKRSCPTRTAAGRWRSEIEANGYRRRRHRRALATSFATARVLLRRTCARRNFPRLGKSCACLPKAQRRNPAAQATTTSAYLCQKKVCTKALWPMPPSKRSSARSCPA